MQSEETEPGGRLNHSSTTFLQHCSCLAVSMKTFNAGYHLGFSGLYVLCIKHKNLGLMLNVHLLVFFGL